MLDITQQQKNDFSDILTLYSCHLLTLFTKNMLFHAMTLSVIYYSTHEQQYEIYLLINMDAMLLHENREYNFAQFAIR